MKREALIEREMEKLESEAGKNDSGA